jgi:DNA-nicking Smr family endonuclease
MARGREGEADAAAWAWFTRQVTPLAGRRPLPLAHVPAPPQTAPAAAPARDARPPRVPGPAEPPRPAGAGRAGAALQVNLHPPGVDGSTWQRFRAGRLPVQRTLDLHGRTAQAAFHALTRFLANARAEGVRCVEVITGRGSGETGGVLRRELPLWLNLPDIRPLILAAAHPHAANQGAVRLLLRRGRQGGR